MLRASSTSTSLNVERASIDGPVTPSADWGAIFWFYPEAWASDTYVKMFQIDGFISVRVRHDTGDELRAILLSALDGGNEGTADAEVTVRTGEWHLCMVSWDQSAETISTWMRNETDTVATGGPTTATSYSQAATDHDFWALGRAGDGSMQGVMSRVIFRSHTLTTDDFNRIWNSGAPTIASMYDNANFDNASGSTDYVIWDGPDGTRTGLTDGGYIGDDVESDAHNLALGESSAFSASDNIFKQEVDDLTGTHVVETGANAIELVNVLGTGSGYHGFFQKNDLGIAPATPYITSTSQPLYEMANDSTPTKKRLVMVTANSRVARTSEDDNGMQSHKEAVIRQRKDKVLGVLQTAFCESGGGGHVGNWSFTDDTYKVSDTAAVIGTADAYSNTLTHESFGCFALQTTNNNQTGAGSAVFIPASETCFAGIRVVADSIHDDKSRDAYCAWLMLKFPGAGTVGAISQWYDTGMTTASNQQTFGSFDCDTEEASHTFTASDSWTAGTKTMVLDSTTGLGLEAGWACFVSSGTGVNGINVIESVSEGGGDTTIVFQQTFLHTAPSTSSVLKFGPVSMQWAGGVVDGITDSNVVKGTRIDAVGGPVVAVAFTAFDANATNGWIVGSAGRSGTGYSSLLADSFLTTDDYPFWMDYIKPHDVNETAWLTYAASQGDTDGDTYTDWLDALQAAGEENVLAILDPQYAEDLDVEAMHDGVFTYLASNSGIACVDLTDSTAGLGDAYDLLEQGYMHDHAHVSAAGADAIFDAAMSMAQSAVAAEIAQVGFRGRGTRRITKRSTLRGALIEV